MGFTPSDMNSIAKVISQEMGLHYPPNRHDELLNGIRKTALALEGRFTIESIIDQIQSGKGIHPDIFRELSIALTVNETYFFREETTIQFIRNLIIPEILESKDHYNIWSAGCSSGEEPYTLAMLLKEHLPPEIFKDVTIKATDISPKALEKAKEGKYTEWSFRETPAALRNKYFHKVGKLWQISNVIREKVEFSILNLAKENYPSQMTGQYNMILCRNVIIYFSNETSKKIADNLHDTLKESGWLVTSQVELNDQIFGKFARIPEGNGFFYRKSKMAQTPHYPIISPEIQLRELHKQEDTAKFGKQLAKHREIKSQIYSAHNKKIAGNTQNSKTNQPDKTQYKKALELAGSRQYTKSMIILEELMSRNHFEADFFYLYGVILLEINERERAIEYFKKTLYLDPGHLLSEYMLGMLYRQEGKETLSKKYLRRAFENASRENPEKMLDNLEGLTAGHIAEELRNIV
jgi:chemotaxis protein methyltransferase CheR